MSSFDRAHMTSYRRSIATMGRSRTVSEINGDFGRKSQIFPTPCILRPTEGVPLGIGYRRRDQK